MEGGLCTLGRRLTFWTANSYDRDLVIKTILQVRWEFPEWGELCMPTSGGPKGRSGDYGESFSRTLGLLTMYGRGLRQGAHHTNVRKGEFRGTEKEVHR